MSQDMQLKNLYENYLVSYGMTIIASYLIHRLMIWDERLSELGYSKELIDKCWMASVDSIFGMVSLTKFETTEEEVLDILKKYNG